MKTKNYVVKKSNILNELQLSDMTLFEYKLFCVVLSKLNFGYQEGTVIIPLKEYAEIMDIKRVRHSEIKRQCSDIVKKTCVINFQNGSGYGAYAFIHACKVYLNQDKSWVIELKINPELLPLVIEGQKMFMSYKLYNTIYLNSYQHIRIYELLKQYEAMGERIIELNELRNYLSIGSEQYKEWYEFSRCVLLTAQRALKKNTDIEFEYFPIRENRKIKSIKFEIQKKKGYVDPFEDILQMSNFARDNEVANNTDSCDELRDFFSGAISKEETLSRAQIDYVISTAWKSDFAKSLDVPATDFEFRKTLYSYIEAQDKYTAAKSPDSYFGYLISAIKENYACIES